MLNPISSMEIYIEKEILEKLNNDFLSDKPLNDSTSIFQDRKE